MLAYTVTGDKYKYLQQTAGVHLGSDTVKAMLMRQGFVFDSGKHRELKNIQTNTGAIALTWAATDRSVSRGSGSFITDGFVFENLCTSDDTNNPGPLTIATVTALKITFVETVVNSSDTKTLTSNDELAGGHGYTAGGQAITLTVAEDNVNHRSDATAPTTTWNASGGSIGPSDAEIIYNSTADCVIQCTQYGESKTATTGNPFNLYGLVIRNA